MNIWSALSIAVALTAGFTACTNDDNIIRDEQSAAVKTYTVSIPASFEGDATTRAVTFDNSGATPTSASTFETTEKVYVYNATTDEVMGGYLQPTDISANGKSCNLTGTLTGTINAGDNLRLMYNLNVYDSDPVKCKFDYGTQDGTQSGVLDGAEATVTVSSYTRGGVLTTTAIASFQLVQSMFRFQFVDENNAPISVKVLRIQSSSFGIRSNYFPIRTGAMFGVNDVMLNLPTATSDYIYFGLTIDENFTDDVLTFTVTDADGNVYQGTKSAPSSGFKNGKYYYNTSAITLTKQDYMTPDITWTSVLDNQLKSPNENKAYVIYGPNFGPSEITISGICKGYYFRMEGGATIHLNGLTAMYDEDASFIYCTSNLNLNLDISGTNSITCRNFHQAIFDEGTLKLSGSGTLTVTARSEYRYGLYASSNFYNWNYDYVNKVDLPANNSDASVLAAPGYTVTRSARTDNADGTYTWTYTVAPVPLFTVNAGGTKVLFAPGNLQATYDGTSWSWAFAANQWDYIGNAAGNTSINGDGTVSADNVTVDLFGWVGASNSKWSGNLGTTGNAAMYGISNSTQTSSESSYGNVTNEPLKSDWGKTIDASGNTWRTLTTSEWEYIFNTRVSGSTVNSTSNARYTHATINTDGTGVNGMILFPDGITVANGEATSWGRINSFLYDSSTWADATKCTSAQWTALAAKGCVFLPAAGWRVASSVEDAGYKGLYWSSKSDNSVSYWAFGLVVEEDNLEAYYPTSRYAGGSVRLVRDL